MRGVMLADTHLGHVRYAATAGGRNVRTQDVENAWTHAIGLIVQQQPDLVTLSGDCFDHARPSMHALRAFQLGVLRMLRETNARVLIIPGNHDAMKTVEALSPTEIASGLDQRVTVVHEPTRLFFDVPRTGERVGVSCFPFTTLSPARAFELAPGDAADVSVLLIHAAVRSSAAPGALPRFYANDEHVDVGPLADLYHVVAAGDYHSFTRLHPTRIAAYPGSLERVSADPWKETEPKGVVAYDSDTGALEFLEIPTRPMLDFRHRLGGSTSAATVNDNLRALAADLDVDGAMVRLVVEDFPREERDEIDQKLIARLRERCLHFALELRYRESVAREITTRRRAMVRSLDEEAAAYFADDPADVRDTAIGYLSAAGAA